VTDYDTNIRAAFEAATPDDLAKGLRWYANAQREGRKVGPTLHRGVGVIAALSPLQAWDVNIELANKLAAVHAEGKPMPTTGYGFKRNTAKAWAILNGAKPLDVLSGPKVRAFYRNMLGCSDSVTVDRWAVRIAIGDPDHSGTVPSGEYDAMADAFRRVAAEKGLTPRELQAATWTWVRRVHARANRDPKHWQ
jgi:hypothetical protein